MPRDRLVINEIRGAYYLTWFIVDEDDYGATLGDVEYTREALQKAEAGIMKDPELVEMIVLSMMAKELSDGRSADGYYWDSLSGVKKALAAIKARQKTLTDSRPWPDWALTAVKNGWKAPKGWKP